LIGKIVFICFHVKSSNYNELPRRKKPSDAGLDDILSPRLHENQMAELDQKITAPLQLTDQIILG
jgi:hypothetical protein